ncbi:MAG TPA: HD domain-containing phosphohydrolase [bacterium]
MRYLITPAKPRILIADDEKELRFILQEFLSQYDYITDVAEDGVEAMEKLRTNQYSILILDLDMPKLGGMGVLNKLGDFPNKPVTILMTGYATVENAIESMKIGAFDYIVKPFKMEHLLLSIEKGLEKKRLEIENIQLKEMLTIYNISESMSNTLDINRILELIVSTIQNELNSDITILLIFGDSGEPEIEKSINRTNLTMDNIIKSLNLGLIKNKLEKDIPIILSSLRVSQVFKSRGGNTTCHSILAVGIKSQNALKGCIFTFSFTKGKEFTEGQRKFVSIIADRAAMSIENSLLYAELQQSFNETIQALVQALEAKDFYTRGHSEKVTDYAKILTEDLALSNSEAERIYRAALLHDIGKIGMQLEALNKAGKLTEKENEKFRMHPLMGKKIIESVTFLKDIVADVYFHHEKWNGTGYPEGRKGEDIPIGARIISIVDSFTAMTEKRSYRDALKVEQAAEELINGKETQFDPHLVDIFIKGLKKRKILKTNSTSESKNNPNSTAITENISKET